MYRGHVTIVTRCAQHHLHDTNRTVCSHLLCRLLMPILLLFQKYNQQRGCEC